MFLEGEGKTVLGVHWTIGDVSERGFEALQLSIRGAWKLFGERAQSVVCVNSIPAEVARACTGVLPAEITWRQVTRDDLPAPIKLGNGMAEGTGWKFCPPLIFRDVPELALDNDCILWRMPSGLKRWLKHGRGCLIAEDARPHLGRFGPKCGYQPRNSGIRGVAAGFPFEAALAHLANGVGELLTEGDEQGLHVAAVHAEGPPELIRLEEVSICSPFPPHVQALGSCGVHFVGLNAKQFDWDCDGRDPAEMTRENWQKLKPDVEARLLQP